MTYLFVLLAVVAVAICVFFIQKRRKGRKENDNGAKVETPAPQVINEPEAKETPEEKPKDSPDDAPEEKTDGDKQEDKPSGTQSGKEAKELEYRESVLDILKCFAEVKTVKEGTATFDYLVELYKEAWSQYYNGYTCHGLPSIIAKKNFPNIYDFYGDKGDETSAFRTLVGWLFAMQLSELSPISRNDLFTIGYKLGGYDKDSDLYGYKFKCDPNVCRLSASVIYAMMRGSLRPDIGAMYSEVGGFSLSSQICVELAREYDSLRVSDGDIYVDLRRFMPTAPGPYAPRYEDRSRIGGHPYPTEEKESDHNLSVDRRIRDLVVEKYNLYSTDILDSERTAQAIGDKDPHKNHLFGKWHTVNGFALPPVFTELTLGREVNPSLAAELCSLVDDALHIGSYQRCILQFHEGQCSEPAQYGRLRPGCSWEREGERLSDETNTAVTCLWTSTSRTATETRRATTMRTVNGRTGTSARRLSSTTL